jgi:hypothetical protein
MRRLGCVDASRGAVAGAMHDAEEGRPRADRIAILVGHDAGELMKVSQIVRGPSGQELSKRDGSEPLMCACFREVRRAQLESFEGGQVLRTERSESIEQLFESLAAAFCFMSETIEGIEREGFTVFEDAFDTGHPIGALTGDEVSHDIESAPAISAFACSHPPAGQAAEERIQRRRSAR